MVSRPVAATAAALASRIMGGGTPAAAKATPKVTPEAVQPVAQKAPSVTAAIGTGTLVPLSRLQILTRLPRSNHREVTVYVKGFLQQGEDPKNFDEWLQSHHLLALSPKHNWDGLSFGYSWNSGALLHPMTLPIPLTTATTLAARALTATRILSPAALLASLALDTTFNLGKLAYQFRTASSAAASGAPALAETLRALRRDYDHVRVVAHSLGCRHVAHAVQLMDPQDRPDTLHLCAPAMTNAFFKAAQTCGTDVPGAMDAASVESMREWGDPDPAPVSTSTAEHTPLARLGTYVYWTPADTVLAIMFRAVALGDSAMGHVGVQPPPPPGPSPEALSVAHAEGMMYQHDGPPEVIHVGPHGEAPTFPKSGTEEEGEHAKKWGKGSTLESIDVTSFFPKVSVVHQGYAARFHYFAREYWHANDWQYQ